MAQRLRVLANLPRDLDLILRTYMVLSMLTAVCNSRRSDIFFWLLWTLGMYIIHKYTHMYTHRNTSTVGDGEKGKRR